MSDEIISGQQEFKDGTEFKFCPPNLTPYQSKERQTLR